MAAEPLQNLLLALLATAVSYLVLTGYDLSAMKYAEVPDPPVHGPPDFLHRVRAR